MHERWLEKDGSFGKDVKNMCPLFVKSPIVSDKDQTAFSPEISGVKDNLLLDAYKSRKPVAPLLRIVVLASSVCAALPYAAHGLDGPRNIQSSTLTDEERMKVV